MKSNWQYLVLAFVLAIFSWHFVSGREKVDTWIQMPVEMVNAPQGYVVRQGMVSRIEVRVRGPRPMVRGIDMKNAVYPLNLAQLQPGLNVLDFEAGDIPLSRAIEVMEIVPPRVELVVDRLQSKVVPVQAHYEVQLDEDFELKQVLLKPDSITVRGPQEILDPVETVQTQKITVAEERPQIWEGVIGVVLPAEVEASPARVSAQLIFGEKVQEKWVEAIVQAPELEGRSVKVSPGKVRLLLQMPVSMVREGDYGDALYVTLEDMKLLGTDRYQLGYRVSIPPGSMLMQAEPELLEVTISEKKD